MRVTQHYSHKQILHDYMLHKQTLENFIEKKILIYLIYTVTERRARSIDIANSSISFNIYLGAQKTPWNGSFEYSQYMF